MGISAGDVRRALLGGGDVSTFVEVCRKALGNPPICTIDSLETEVALPETTALLKSIDKDLARLVVAWAEGKHYRLPPETETDLTLVCLAPWGRNTASHVERVIDEIKPDIIALDVPPLDLRASMLYALSVPCALGLPVYGEIATGDHTRFYGRRVFYPGNVNQTAIVKSWLSGIPLLPVGMPRMQPKHPRTDFTPPYADETRMTLDMSKSDVLEAYHALDASLESVTGLQESLKIGREIGVRLMKTIDGQMRDKLIEEACYTASRTMEIAACANALGRKARLLALVDVRHHQDVEYVTGLLKRGLLDEIYVPPRSCDIAEDMVMTAYHAGELDEQAKTLAPETTSAQEMFQGELDRLMSTRDSEALTESALDRLIPAIVGRSRIHPGIARGASVRGTIAFREVLHAFSEMKGDVTRGTVGRAAMITLPPRVVARRGSSEAAIISDVVKEVLYDMRFSGSRREISPPHSPDWLSPGDIAKSLDSLKEPSQEQSQGPPSKEPPTIIAEQAGRPEALRHLESEGFPRKGRGNRYSTTQQASECLTVEMTSQLKAGEVTPVGYGREKARLEAASGSASLPGSGMSARELATTIMDLMDAQDRHWGGDLTPERMHVYYHLKANEQGSDLSPQKRSYYELEALVDDLQKRGILMAAEAGKGLTLSGHALDALLDYLTDSDSRERWLRGAMGSGKALASERKPEIRRYSSGDVFRDISFRHTLREIARQKKDMSGVRRGDFRVFLKQRRKQQSDIVLCLDTSGSMNLQYKLAYARIAAAGLARAAIEDGDRVGVVAFDNLGQTTMSLTDRDAEPVIDCIAGLSGRGNTNIADGIKCSRGLLFQNHSGNQKYIMLITDGRPTAISERAFGWLKQRKGKDLTEESAILETGKAAAEGVRVSVVHVASRNEGNEGFIKSIARAGRGRVYHLSGIEALMKIDRG